ncbi:MAG: YggT family protein [Actinomycetota bacterium]|jgi:YggT family protein|nr:YggT family protein [Actinomycetota bacterium]
MGLVCSLLNLYLILLFARIILSWFPVSPGGTMAQIFSFLYTVTEPVLGPVRRAIPPIGMGGMGFDLSPIIVIFGVQIIERVVFGC